MFPTTTNELTFPFLTIIVFLPLAGAFLCSTTDVVKLIRASAIVTVSLDFVLSIVLLVAYKVSPSGPGWQFQFADKHDWIPTL